MSSQNTLKINQLLQDWPQGTVATQAWLESKGIYRQLTKRYLSSGWLERIGRGAYVRAGAEVDWLGGVYALQHQLGINVRIAAVTALLLRGLGHYLPLGKNYRVQILGNPHQQLPNWFTQYSWDVQVSYRCPNIFGAKKDSCLTEIDRGSFSVFASAPERAILEVMFFVDSNASFDHAVELCEGLTTLRPDVVQGLLESCRSVKAKRLFLWASERSGHAWLNRIDVSKVDLGKGKRALYERGKLDNKYLITVPRDGDLPSV